MQRHPTILLVMAFIVFFNSANVNSQSVNTFKPHGKPLVLIFTKVNTSFNKSGSSPAFEITRAYLGYEYFFSKNISSRINIDVADPGAGELQMTAFIKNAYLQYKNNGFSARLGMIGVDQYNLQEKLWGHRYIYKSFQDEYKFGPSADLGAAFEYSPSEIISFDFSILNGEGYKKIESDSTLKTTFGLTLRPLRGLELRGYFDRMKKDYAQTSFALFAGYTINKFKAGAEYNIQKNHGMINQQDFYGISVYSSLALPGKFSVFARYDYLSSEDWPDSEGPWNESNDGQAFIAGFEYSPVQGVRIAPSYIGWLPSENENPMTSTIALNFEIKF